MIAKTSLWSYYALKKDNKIGKRVIEYVEALKRFGNFGASDREVRMTIADMTGSRWELGTVSARRNDALELGIVKERGIVKDLKTGRLVKLWKVC